MLLYLDLETIPTESPEVIAELSAAITHPKNMSKADTIAKWGSEEKPALVEEAVRKTSFDGGLGRIVCIGYAIDNSEPAALFQGPEKTILEAFFDVVKTYSTGKRGSFDIENPMVYVGHNIAGFDLRFLWQRAVVNRVKPPSSIPFNAKPWDKGIVDTMTMWNPERERKVSLDRLCKILGVASSKGDLDGSKVWDYVKAGKIAEVAEYCKGDIQAVRACHQRMAFVEQPKMADLPF